MEWQTNIELCTENIPIQVPYIIFVLCLWSVTLQLLSTWKYSMWLSKCKVVMVKHTSQRHPIHVDMFFLLQSYSTVIALPYTQMCAMLKYSYTIFYWDLTFTLFVLHVCQNIVITKVSQNFKPLCLTLHFRGKYHIFTPLLLFDELYLRFRIWLIKQNVVYSGHWNSQTQQYVKLLLLDLKHIKTVYKMLK